MTLKRMGLLAILVLLAAFNAAPATATAGLGCSIDDANLSFGLGGPDQPGIRKPGRPDRRRDQAQGQAGPENGVDADPRARRYRDVLEYERELRIGINVENDTGSVFLWIVTQQNKGRESYSGRCVLRVSIFGTDIIGREFKGRI
jgi:hypothetical protein